MSGNPWVDCVGDDAARQVEWSEFVDEWARAREFDPNNLTDAQIREAEVAFDTPPEPPEYDWDSGTGDPEE